MNVILDKETHRYTNSYNPGLTFCSTSDFVNQYHDGFDADYHIDRLSKKIGSKYYMMEKEEILKMWKDKRDKGTAIHDEWEKIQLEWWNKGQVAPSSELLKQLLASTVRKVYKHPLSPSNYKLYCEQCVWIPCLGYQYDNLDELWPDQKNWHPMAKFFSSLDGSYKEAKNLEHTLALITDVAIAGTIDTLLVNRYAKHFYILDLKTDNKIYQFSRKRFYEPISHIKDNTHNYYALKMSIYALMVEFWMPGYSCQGLKIIHLPNGEKFNQVLDLPYFRQEAITLINDYAVPDGGESF